MDLHEARPEPVPQNIVGTPGYFGKVRRKPPEILTRDEVRTILRAIPDKNRRDRAIILMLYHHAMRASEICDMSWSNYDIASGRLTWWRRKQNDWMRHHIHREAEYALSQYRSLRRWDSRDRRQPEPDPEEPMFLSQRGEALTPNGLWRLVRKWMLKAGIPVSKCHPHTFRHSKATALLKCGADVTMVQRYLGHASPRTTAETYLHPDTEGIRQVAERDNLFS